MAINQKQIDEWFEVPVLTEPQETAYAEVHAAGKAYAEIVNKTVPDCEQKIQLIQQVRSTVLSAELAIRSQWPKSLFAVN